MKLFEESFQRNLEALRSRSKEMDALLVRWCEINSGTGNSEGLEQMLEALKKEFRRLPGKMEEISLPPVQEYNCEGRLARRKLGKLFRMRHRPEAPAQVLLSGHFDTVFGRNHPFQTCSRPDPNTLIGPGSADMKGGLVILLAALEVFEGTEGKEKENLGWEIIIGPDEEIGSPGSAPVLKKAAKAHHFGLVFESTLGSGKLARNRMGLGTFTAVMKGRAAHVGRDFPKGRNAIAGLSEFVVDLQKMNQSVPGAIFNVGNIRGGGPANIVPDRACAQFNIRIKSPSDISGINAMLAERVGEANGREGFELAWDGRFTRYPKVVGPATEALFQAFKECGKAIGLTLEWEDTGGGSDGNILAEAGLPNLDTLGARGGNIHSEREYVHLPSLLQRSRLTALFLKNLAVGKTQLAEAMVRK